MDISRKGLLAGTLVAVAACARADLSKPVGKIQGFEREERRALLPDDAADMVGFRMGGLPCGRKLNYWVRNFRLIRRKSETATRKDKVK